MFKIRLQFPYVRMRDTINNNAAGRPVNKYKNC